MRRKTAFSRRNEIIRHTVRSKSRDVAAWISSALCPSTRPAITTARTPDPWISSATRYAANGVTSVIDVSVRVSST